MSQSQARVIRDLRAERAVLQRTSGIPFPVPSAPTIVLALSPSADGDRWSITRTGWNEPSVLLPGVGWVPLESVAIADRYCWTDSAALQQVPALLAGEEQAVAAWRAKHEADAERARGLAAVAEEWLEAAAAVLPAETVPVVTLQDAHQDAADPGIDVPAPRDVPGYGQTPARMAATVRDKGLGALAETDEDQELLTALGRSIPATLAPEVEPEPESDPDATQVIDAATVRELAGMGDTAVMAAVAWPPMPDHPPVTPEPALTH